MKLRPTAERETRILEKKKSDNLAGCSVLIYNTDMDAVTIPHAFAANDDSERWFWSPEWQKKEAEADEDIRKGRVSKKFSSYKALIKALDVG